MNRAGFTLALASLLAAHLAMAQDDAGTVAATAAPLAPPPANRPDPGNTSPFADAFRFADARIVKLYGAAIGGERGYGTGVVVSEDGKVVTTLSLLLEAGNLRAVTPDGHVYAAEVIYRDEYRQLALLKLARHPENPDTSASVRDQMTALRIDPMPIGDSAHLLAGDWVLAISNCFRVADGEEPVSVMKGVVSGRAPLDAMRGTQPYPYRGEVILVDAITNNPGAPGGALVDLQGRWVGLIGKQVTSRLTNTALNYCLPVEEVRAFLEDAASGAHASTRPALTSLKPGYHGISLSKIAYRKEIPFVRSVARSSPAAEAGVKPDDLIVSANGTAVARSRVFRELTDRLNAGDTLSLVIKRGDELVTVRMTLTEEPEKK